MKAVKHRAKVSPLEGQKLEVFVDGKLVLGFISMDRYTTVDLYINGFIDQVTEDAAFVS